jgi:PQQ-dependent catabolism-associated CXXCW motif protein
MTGLRSGLGWALAAAAGICFAQSPIDPGGESEDFGIPSSSAMRLQDFSSPTPREIPGGRTLRTMELRALLEGPEAERPLIFDVLGGSGHDSIPGAIWLADAGRGESFEDATQDRFARTLEFLLRDGKPRTLVFYCGGKNCWLSYNAALRAIRLGHADVGWYRGGLESWRAAGGALAPMRVGWQRPARAN